MTPGRQMLPLALALALLLAALVLPPLSLPGRAPDTVVVFDITQSMDVEDHALDGEPIDRLRYARRAARDALATLPCGARVGWAAFAEYRTLLLLAPIEVCAHYDDLLATLEAVDGRMRWGHASEVTKGAYWALRMAQDTGGRPNVVFVTDGHEAPPLRGAPELFEDIVPGAIHGWILGAGGHEARPIPKTDPDGRRRGFWRPEDVVQPEGDASRRREHLSSLHEAHLQALAARIGFDYARLTPDTLVAAMRDDRFTARRAVPTDVRFVPAGLALALLAWAFRPGRRGGGRQPAVES